MKTERTLANPISAPALHWFSAMGRYDVTFPPHASYMARKYDMVPLSIVKVVLEPGRVTHSPRVTREQFWLSTAHADPGACVQRWTNEKCEFVRKVLS